MGEKSSSHMSNIVTEGTGQKEPGSGNTYRTGKKVQGIGGKEKGSTNPYGTGEKVDATEPQSFKAFNHFE
ncbi:hypothetical protein QN277_001758 [Acacia crassicarpa]|uniref:Uncharacterized protein n=1 Tax=Acacia crassicarpa TaxID=499986 RepID=A0AAE1TIR2_9FABA|nr:hypothetical protein QN277_001758 [Acacia crassicarpa]